VDTYNPEEERYGGEQGLDVSEQVFEADSDAALSIVKHFRGDPEARWKLVLLGMDALLEDLGFSIEEKRQVVFTCQREQMLHYANCRELPRQLGSKYRELHSEIESLFVSPQRIYSKGIEAIQIRSGRLIELADRLRKLEKEGALFLPRTTIAGSYLHMWANRVLRDSINAHEIVLYDSLYRTYSGRIVRGDD
jgi:thiopeptide-type bacteriocin biosynthesis protein